MKCPIDATELESGRRHDVAAEVCPKCRGMWLAAEALTALEDEAFELDEHAKGTLVFDAAPTDHACPACGGPLQGFSYRAFDLPLEYCPDGHGYWLDAGEDDRVLELMRKEEADIERSFSAEQRWSRLIARLRSGSLVSRLRGLVP